MEVLKELADQVRFDRAAEATFGGNWGKRWADQSTLRKLDDQVKIYVILEAKIETGEIVWW